MAKKRVKRAFRRAKRRAVVVAGRAVRHARRTVGEHKHELVTPAAAVATAGAIGYLDNPERGADAFKLPTVGGVMPEALYAVGLGVLGTMVGATAKGTHGKVIRGAAAGLASVAAYKLASGQPLMAEKTGEDDDTGYTEDTE